MTITVNGPNGVTIDFPDGTTPDVIHRAFNIDQMATDASINRPPMGTAEDVARSFGTGVAEGTLSLPGMLGDIDTAIRDVSSYGANTVRGWMGQPPAAKPPTISSLLFPKMMQSGENARAALYPAAHELTGYSPHKPETMLGQGAETIGSFIPGVVATGGIGAGKGATLAERALTAGKGLLHQAVIPGIATEAVGQVANKYFPEFENAARGVTSVVAGAHGAAKTVPEALPRSSTDIKAASQTAYRASEAMGVQIAQVPFARMINDIGKDVPLTGGPKVLHPMSTGAFKELKAARGEQPTLARVDELRQVIGEAIDSGNENDVRRALGMHRKIDHFLDNLGPNDVVAGNRVQAVKMIKEARRLWSQQLKTKIIEKAMRNAQFTMAGQKGNIDNAVRGEFFKIAKNPDFASVFTPAERAAIEDVAKADRTERALRFVSSYAPENRPLLAMVAASAATAGYPHMLPIPIAGNIARTAASNRIMRQAAKAQALVSGGRIPGARRFLPLSLFQTGNMATTTPPGVLDAGTITKGNGR